MQVALSGLWHIKQAACADSGDWKEWRKLGRCKSQTPKMENRTQKQGGPARNQLREPSLSPTRKKGRPSPSPLHILDSNRGEGCPAVAQWVALIVVNHPDAAMAHEWSTVRSISRRGRPSSPSEESNPVNAVVFDDTMQ